MLHTNFLQGYDMKTKFIYVSFNFSLRASNQLPQMKLILFVKNSKCTKNVNTIVKLKVEPLTDCNLQDLKN